MVFKLFNRLSVVDVHSLLEYEETSEEKVDKLITSLKNEMVLRDPVVIDNDLNLLIDGHHRIHALDSIGVKNVPAFNVSYLSMDVSISPYYYYLSDSWLKSDFDVLISQANSARQSLQGKASCSSTISILRLSPNVETLTYPVLGSTLELVTLLRSMAEDMGHKVSESYEFRPKAKTQENSWCVFFNPFIQKDQVLNMTRKGRLFPPHINKHILKDRVVNLCVPIEELMKYQKEAYAGIMRRAESGQFDLVNRQWEYHDGICRENHWTFRAFSESCAKIGH